MIWRLVFNEARLASRIGYFVRGQIISYLRGSDGSQRALMPKHYETLDVFRISDGRGCALCSWPGFSKDC